jgi:hypothetical protein
MARSPFPVRAVLLAFATMTALAVAALAAEPAGKPAKPEVTTGAADDAMMAEMMKYASPGPGHEKLKAMEGKWKTVSKMWLAPGEPTVTEGSSENRLILGGRYLEQRYQGTFMGQPFEGYGLTGYDNKKSVYTTLWVDNTSTEMMTGEGEMDAAGKELVFRSMGAGPDGRPMETKSVTRIVDPNRHVFSMYGMVDGKEQLMMEITYTRM